MARNLAGGMATDLTARSRVRPAGLLLAALLLHGCVSAARHEEAVAESKRLARENLELRRALAEQKVRAQEAMEAMREAREPSVPEGPAARELSPALQAPLAIDANIPLGAVAEPPPAILDQDIRDPVLAPESGGGDDGILRVARRYAGAGKTSEAIVAYTRLINDYPFSPLLPEAFFERGRLRLQSGDRAGALEDFDTVAEAFPRSPQAPEARRLADSLRRP